MNSEFAEIKFTEVTKDIRESFLTTATDVLSLLNPKKNTGIDQG